jgi:hypothetical protein
VVEEEMCDYVSGIVEGRHGFGPFGKVIYYQDIVLVSITRWRISSHEVYAPFSKGDGSDDWMYKRGWLSCFVFIELGFVPSLDSMDLVMKQCGPEVSCSNDFLGGGNT